MSPMENVQQYYPGAFVAPMSSGVYDVIVESNRPSPGYRAHKALGAGLTPAAAWLDAAQRILRRGNKPPTLRRSE